MITEENIAYPNKYTRIVAGLPVIFTGNALYKKTVVHYEILCVHCGLPKFITKGSIKLGTGLKHHGCRINKISIQGNATAEAQFVNKMYREYTRTDSFGRRRKSSIIRKVYLTVAQFKKIVLSPCFYCGGIDKRTMRSGQVIEVNGIDRYNNNGEYTLENSVPCCIICNHAKHTLPIKIFMSWIKRICAYNDAVSATYPTNNLIN